MERTGPFERFCESSGRGWPAIHRARQKAREVRQLLKVALSEYETADLNIVLFGSLAREEWTSGSDVDWTLLVDGIANADHFRVAQQIQSTLSGMRFEEKPLSEPGKSGVFGTLTFSHDLVHHLGGQSDTNINTTRRVLLALESVGLRGDARNQTLRAILWRYLEDDFRFEEGLVAKVPRFLLNDIVRFWRTLCVDYGMKRWTDETKWALRNVKLRMSRKWLFTSGLLMMFACDEGESMSGPNEGARARTMSKLVSLTDQTPTDIIVEQFLSLGLDAELSELLDLYDGYLARIDHEDTRLHLSKLSPEQARDDKDFAWFKTQGRKLHDVLGRAFLGDNDRLALFTKEYAVF